MKNFIYSLIGLSLLGLNSVNVFAIDFNNTTIDSWIVWDTASADTAVQKLITNAIWFLYLVAIVFGLWGGFNILTAWGNDEKVKKGKTIIIQALIGLVVIWLASSVVNWVVTKLLGSTTV